MDIKINNSDISLDSQGEYEFVSGIDEVVQKLLMCAEIRKGSFIYNKDLGTTIRDIDPVSDRRALTATAILNEALIDIKGAKVQVESYEKKDGKTVLNVKVSYIGAERNVEVMLNENI